MEHALVTGAYNAGAYYPVGGPDRIAQALGQVIAGAGGEVRLGACVEQITLAAGRASGVTLRSGAVEDAGAGAGLSVSVEHAHWVISAMGAANTAAALPADAAPAWQQAVGALRPGLSYIALYLGFEGDIRAAGASAANHWIYASPDIGQVWLDPVNADAPGLFVSFGSLKDPACTGGPTGEVLALCDSRAFAPWLHPASGVTPPDYAATKALIAARLLAQFMRHFPALAPLLRFHELATPVTQQRYAHSPDGAMYGLEMSAARLASPALDVRTPVPGLLLAGQDVGGAGVPAAAISGLMAAAVVAPTLWRRLG